jgi:mercuric ion binding protein
MRRLLAFLLALPLMAFSGEPKTVTLDVKNMSCELCPLAVKKALEKVSGVSAVKVDFASKTATVTYDPDQTQPEALVKATTDAGYPSTVRE